MASNLSDLHKALSKSMKMIEGVQVPDLPQFDAKQCYVDVRFKQVCDEIHNSSFGPMMTPRGNIKSDGISYKSGELSSQ